MPLESELTRISWLFRFFDALWELFIYFWKRFWSSKLILTVSGRHRCHSLRAQVQRGHVGVWIARVFNETLRGGNTPREGKLWPVFMKFDGRNGRKGRSVWVSRSTKLLTEKKTPTHDCKGSGTISQINVNESTFDPSCQRQLAYEWKQNEPVTAQKTKRYLNNIYAYDCWSIDNFFFFLTQSELIVVQLLLRHSVDSCPVLIHGSPDGSVG